MKGIKKIKQFILQCLMAVFIISCNQNHEKVQHSIFEKQDSISPPAVIPAGKPIINYLTETEPPKITLLSKKPAPVKTNAGFYVNMQNFNTQQGLAMSSILSGFKDKAGNLWFGTSGNGVSKYDGKSFTNYTSSHGLIHNLINHITEDSKGNIWFGTYGGISKYDGVTFQNFTTEDGIPDVDVLKIMEDSKGTLWIGTAKGLCSFTQNRTDGKLLLTSHNQEDVLLNASVIDILEDSQGQLWFAGDQGVWKYIPATSAKEQGTFMNFSDKFGIEDKVATVLMEDHAGIIWVGTYGAVGRYAPAKSGFLEKTFKPLTVSDGLVNNAVMIITIDKQDMVWIGTKGGVSKYDKNSESFINFTVEQGLTFNQVNSITEDSSGSLWFGTYGGGLDRYDGESVIEYNTKQGLIGDAIYATTEDNEGNIWLAPSNAGIVKYEQNGNSAYSGIFTTYSKEQGLLANTHYTATKDNDGNLYFGSNEGLSIINGKEITNYTNKNGLPDHFITALYMDKTGKLWIGTYEGGISVFDGKSFSNSSTEQGLVHKTVWYFLEDKDGIMWIATRGGLSRYDGKNFMNFTTEQGLPDNKLSAVIQDKKGNIIIGSWGGGVSIIKKERLEKLKLSNDNQIEPIFENFSTTQGLANDVVYQFLEDDNGNIVIGTNKGFTILKGGIASEVGKIAQNGFENYNEKTGYPIKDISNNQSMHIGGRGNIWAGTVDKLVRFDYNSVRKNTEPLEVFIQNVKINNDNISWRSLEWARKKDTPVKLKNANTPSHVTDELLTFKRKLTSRAMDTMVHNYRNVHFDSLQAFFSIPINLELPYSKNNISFDFVGVETTRPELVNYQYMLEGYNENWNPITQSSTATFGNINEGNYTFFVKAQSPVGVWSEPLEYQFTIRPPWYRAWYAYFFYVLLLFLGIYYVDAFQRRRVLFLERQKGIRQELKHAREIEKAFAELKATQSLLIQSEKMASLGELTAGIAHEIQNPLNFVNNFSEVSKELLDELKTELEKGNIEDSQGIVHDVIENLQKINLHGKRAESIVKGMLQHSRVSTGVRELVDINKLTDEYLRLAYHGLRAKDKSFNASLNTDYDDSIGKIEIVPQDIGRVILNLIVNAFYAVNERKQLNSPDYQPTVSVCTKQLKDSVEIHVVDNGNGMPQIVLDKIFQPFFTTKPSGQGTGLGLSLSYDIVKAHLGDILVKTKEGEGTEFSIKLPKN
ncbi:two-component regulator propeller domain-containing protein [Gillisia hiemivivida]|uniref:histidine kinase n=1 Tax=Gillisia hiemivivida TaxID=291190 RepID=A0A5C6ZZT0_9FLAO|nr:two-component regulator propeller domain-containing protein [Gillisia hiemivivida]TXD95831.1 hypothetical protein ES724_02055 [Gillisia hiemivivida]